MFTFVFVFVNIATTFWWHEYKPKLNQSNRGYNGLCSQAVFLQDKSTMIQATVTKFGTRDDLQQTGVGMIFGSKSQRSRSQVDVGNAV